MSRNVRQTDEHTVRHGGPRVVSPELVPEPLTAAGFAPFGDVIEASGPFVLINDGSTKRFHDLVRIDNFGEGGRAAISIFTVKKQLFPFPVRMLERHPLGSQAFIPRLSNRFLIVVAPPMEHIQSSDLRAFWSDGRQGVNYRAGVWHHPVLATVDDDEFLVIDRVGPGKNCDEIAFSEGERRVLLWA